MLIRVNKVGSSINCHSYTLDLVYQCSYQLSSANSITLKHRHSLSSPNYPSKATTHLRYSLRKYHDIAIQIGVALISFIGILIDYFIYILNQRRSIQQGCYVQKVSYHSFPLRILAGGILSHFFFFAFALLPADQKQRSTTLYAEDRIFLTLSFILNFIFKGYYVFFRYLHYILNNQLEVHYSILVDCSELLSEDCSLYGYMFYFLSL